MADEQPLQTLLSELRGLMEKATLKPPVAWTGAAQGSYLNDTLIALDDRYEDCDADMALIAAAVNALPRLLDALRWRDAEKEPPPIEETIIAEVPWYGRIHSGPPLNVLYVGSVGSDGEFTDGEGDFPGFDQTAIARWLPFAAPPEEADRG